LTFWRSLHKIKHFFKLGTAHVVVDGRRTFFWLDLWVGSQSLKDSFPSLFTICEDPMISFAQPVRRLVQSAFADL
jgi:hypothetical protein